MKVAIIYSSITGNTKLLAEAIKNEIKEEIVYFGKPITEEIDADIYLLVLGLIKVTHQMILLIF